MGPKMKPTHAIDVRTQWLKNARGRIDNDINEWLEDNPNVVIHDIKYSGRDRDGWVTALIVYENKL